MNTAPKRIVKVKREAQWETILFSEIKNGDLIQLFEPTGEQIGDSWAVCSDVYDTDGTLGVHCDPCDQNGNLKYAQSQSGDSDNSV